MATVTKKSLAITNRDAAPRVLNGSYIDGGEVRECAGFCSVTITDVSPSKYVFAQIPSNARVTSIRAFWDGSGGTTTAIHIGVQSTTQAGGGSVSESLFATTVSLASAFTASELVHEAAVAGTSGISGSEKRLWEVLGLANDPNVMYDLVALMSGAADNAGNLGIKVRYVV